MWLTPLGLFNVNVLLADAQSILITIVAFAIVFGVLAFSHEFGHFLLAKMLGMSVEQFGIGFPPNYGWTLFRRSGTSYTLHPIPLGAFVKIQGMDPGDLSSPNAFLKKPAWARLIVFLAGSAANMVLAVLVFMIMGLVTGLPLPGYPTTGVDDVSAKAPAYRAGLRPGDKVVAVRYADRPGKWETFTTRAHGDDATAIVNFVHHAWTWTTVKGKRVPLGHMLLLQTVDSHGKPKVLRARPEVKPAPHHTFNAYLGYQPGEAQEYQKVGFLEAAAGGYDATRANAFTLITILEDRVGALIRREMTPKEFGQGFGSVVMIARVSGSAAREGLAHFLNLLGMISINLAIFNLLPLPVFDGGNIILVLVELVRRKQLEPQQFMMVQLAGLVLIGCLFVYLTYQDILNGLHGTAMP